MANGNGNNINTDDGAAAANAATAAQEQQHLTGDGNGACGDAKLPAGARSDNVNDLVADLWLNGSAGSTSRGDYTNIRATTGSVATMIATAMATATTTAPPITSTASSTNSTNATASSSSTSTFSFKHFLNSSGTITAPSSTVTSLDATGSSSVCSSSSNTNPSSSATAALQTSTGARPKVPQSASVSHMQPDLNGSAASKMKRSPRFSSFDSQASLAEYAACGASGSGSSRLRPDLRLEVERSGIVLDDDDDYEHLGLAQVRNSRLYDDRVDDDIFPSSASSLHAAASNSRYVPRSYSSYDMPPHAACAAAAASPRRRPALRPNRLVLASPSPKMKLDLPLDTSNVAGAASALPDFVQDHLPDSWCQEAHLSSPPNSPLGAAEAPSCSVAMGGGAALLLPAAVAAGLSGASTMQSASDASGSTVKMLPDFLSDGPILHSSQRMADVAIGLPSNSIDSPPQEADGGVSCTLRQENERLLREMQEMRVELNVQTRRAQDYEQQLLAVGDARRRETLAATAQTQNTQRLRRQVAQLEAELFELRHSSDQLTAGAAGAAGAAAVGGASVMTPGSSHSSSSSTSRPSRTQQLSRDLLRAADNAEQNLRQLLAGVDNLRQMAASLEPPTAAAATPRSPNSDQYADFN
ncbi:putative GPI-anchored protein pfl2 [Drosophila hydei]|uniref:GPI-anchored protein pfl2 n=1 Tax=Drosophila hydei TaxID=7224 RepID=A0A6J1LCY7_DROHY|nr:putative GPI-anchored protein pfl2 [Drosophila hydei]